MKTGSTSQGERRALQSISFGEGAMKRGTTSKSVKEALRSISVEEGGASGKGDLMMRRLPKDEAIGRKTGKSRRVKNLSTKPTKLKAAIATFEAKKPAAASSAAAAEAGKEVEAKKPAAVPADADESNTTGKEGGQREAKKPAAAVPPDAVESDTTGKEGGLREAKKPAADVLPDAESDTTGKEGGLRLPQKFVDYVLSWKPEVVEDPDKYYARMINKPAFSREYVERSTKTLRDVAEQFEFCASMMVDYKAWMLAQYEKKGYVEVDDDYIAQAVRQSEELEEDEDYAAAYAAAFGPMDGLITDTTPQSVIDEFYSCISEAT